MIGFRVGACEGSPFIRMLMHAGPVTGVVLSKAIAFGIAGVCLWSGRMRVVGWINYWYAALVIWNVRIIMSSMPPV